MSSIYGSQGDTIAETAFVWATRLDIQLRAPSANAAGTIHTGYFTLSSLLTRDKNTQININQLMQSVTKSIDIKKRAGITLYNSVVNHSIASNLDMIASPEFTEEKDLGEEYVVFAIIERPFTSLTSAANVSYTMSCKVSSNYSFAPKLWDAFSMGLQEDDKPASSWYDFFYKGRKL